MYREPAYRGRTAEGLWVAGKLIRKGKTFFINTMKGEIHKVQRETIGLRFGGKPCNFTLWEDDVVCITAYKKDPEILMIQYDSENDRIRFCDMDDKMVDFESRELCGPGHFEPIGNLHDNPEFKNPYFRIFISKDIDFLNQLITYNFYDPVRDNIFTTGRKRIVLSPVYQRVYDSYYRMAKQDLTDWEKVLKEANEIKANERAKIDDDDLPF